jgi:hypothetical protein
LLPVKIGPKKDKILVKEELLSCIEFIYGMLVDLP